MLKELVVYREINELPRHEFYPVGMTQVVDLEETKSNKILWLKLMKSYH